MVPFAILSSASFGLHGQRDRSLCCGTDRTTALVHGLDSWQVYAAPDSRCAAGGAPMRERTSNALGRVFLCRLTSTQAVVQAAAPSAHQHRPPQNHHARKCASSIRTIAVAGVVARSMKYASGAR
jgi:hypothetical protein